MKDHLLRRYLESGEATIRFSPFDVNKPQRPRRQPGARTSGRAGGRDTLPAAVTAARRYAAAFGITYMWTLTYVEDVTDPARVEADMKAFLRHLWRRTGRQPWLYVIERHPKRGTLHVHLGVATYIDIKLISGVWGLGIVHPPKGELVHQLARGGVEASRALVGYIFKEPVAGASRRRYHRSRGKVRFHQSRHLTVDEGRITAIREFGADPRWQTTRPGRAGLEWSARFAEAAPSRPVAVGSDAA